MHHPQRIASRENMLWQRKVQKLNRQAMEEEISREKKEPFIPDSRPYIDGGRAYLRIMHQAPMLIFIVNTPAAPFNKELSMDEQVSEICNVQSICNAIKNMTLEAAAQVSDSCIGSAVCIRNDNR